MRNVRITALAAPASTEVSVTPVKPLVKPDPSDVGGEDAVADVVPAADPLFDLTVDVPVLLFNVLP